MKHRLIRLGHYTPQSAFILMPIGFSYALGELIPNPPAWLPIAWSATSTAAMLVYGLFVAASVTHDRNLCDRDMPDLPDDPQDAVRRNRWRLRLHHRPHLTISLALAALGLSIGRRFLPDTPAAMWTWAALCVVLCVGFLSGVVMVGVVHQRLIPWCPWCGRGGGRDPEVAPAPGPIGLSRA